MRVLVLAATILAASAAPGVLQAAGPRKFAPEVDLVVRNADKFYEDVHYLMMLTTPREQRQWKFTKEQLDIFLAGVHYKWPGCTTLLMDESVERYRLSIPLANFRNFRTNNLKPLGVTYRRVSGRSYRLGGAFVGYMRQLTDSGNPKFPEYVAIGEKEDDVPFGMPYPWTTMKPLYDLGYIAVIDGNNPEGDGAVAARHEYWEEERREQAAAIKRTRDETTDDFAMRKLLFEHSMDETARIYAETEHLRAGLKVEGQENHAYLNLEATPIADTPFAKNTAMLGEKPSHFANVTKTSENRIVSGRINHPLDEMRQENFLELWALMRKTQMNKIDAETGPSAEEKAADKESTDLFYKLLEENTKGGLVDAFIEGRSNTSGGNTVVMGVKALDGTKLVEWVKLLPKAKKGRELKLDLDKEVDVAIHSLKLADGEQPELRDFTKSDTFYVGTAKKTMWLAGGDGALDDLKAAIGEVAKPNEGKADAPFLSLDMKMHPWARLWHQLRGAKGQVKLRQMAIEAFAGGDDTADLTLEKKGDEIVGRLNARHGVLRYAGKFLADFSAENFEGQ